MFLPDVQKIVDEAQKIKGIEKQLDFIFQSIGNVSLKSPLDMTVYELAVWGKFFGLNFHIHLVPKPPRQKITDDMETPVIPNRKKREKI